jgi:hypothetical protein
MASDPTYRVVIECPRTHKDVDTGLDMTQEAFAHPAVWNSALDCPLCGERHEYDMGHAWLKVDDQRGAPWHRARHPYRRRGK